jgi:hypothetical protein
MNKCYYFTLIITESSVSDALAVEDAVLYGLHPANREALNEFLVGITGALSCVALRPPVGRIGACGAVAATNYLTDAAIGA